MTTIFVSGSRAVTRLPPEVAARLDVIVEKGLRVVVGDAAGADRAVQAHLAARGYADVVVFAAGGVTRNNVGGWPVRAVAAPARERGFALYTRKDRAMADEADYGLQVWDGASAGTVVNLRRLCAAGKASVLFDVRRRVFVEVRGEDGWRSFAGQLDRGFLDEVERKAAMGAVPAGLELALGRAGA